MGVFSQSERGRLCRPVCDPVFLVKPYLQLGKHFSLLADCSLNLIWHSCLGGRDWSVRWSSSSKPQCWKNAESLKRKKIQVRGIARHWQYRYNFTGLLPGERFVYEVYNRGNLVFSAQALAPRPPTQSCRIAVLGDMADGSSSQKDIARQLYASDPDFLVLAGDLVYDHGRVSEYLRHFFPVYNEDSCDRAEGVPLLRSRVAVAVAGNHDVGTPKQVEAPSAHRMPDLGGFFLFWESPDTGFQFAARKILQGKERVRKSLVSLFGKYFTRNTNFSFDVGASHWLVLDGNKYMDWSDEALLEWVKSDLAQAHAACWKCVCFHQPPFNSDYKYHGDHRLRRLAPIFEEYGVDVVFSGHCHFYERTFPLRYSLIAGSGCSKAKAKGRDEVVVEQVPGVLTIDKNFADAGGRPDGVIYVVTGAGGRIIDSLHAPVQASEFTHKLVADRCSFSLLELDSQKFHFRQIDVNGLEIDSFLLSKR